MKNMSKTSNTILLILSMWLISIPIKAQTDPGLAAMIIGFTSKAESQYHSQMNMMAMQTEGHVWLTEEVEAVTNYQKEFDDYLNSFRDVISYAAQTYGFYTEIGHLCDNMERLTRQIGETPMNAVALALHNKRNDIYVDLINKSVGIVSTIRQVCLDSKMKESDRIQLVLSVRPKLQQMNHQLAMLIKLVRSTNMAQVWYDIRGDAIPHREGKAGILEDCLGVWRINGQNAKPNK